MSRVALATGFRALLATSGEDVLLAGSVVRAVVNRNPGERIQRSPDFDLLDESEIRFMASAVSSFPTPGQDIIDTYGVSHRIKTVQSLGDYLTCKCAPNYPDPELLATETELLLLTEDGEPIQAG